MGLWTWYTPQIFLFTTTVKFYLLVQLQRVNRLAFFYSWILSFINSNIVSCLLLTSRLKLSCSLSKYTNLWTFQWHCSLHNSTLDYAGKSTKRERGAGQNAWGESKEGTRGSKERGSWGTAKRGRATPGVRAHSKTKGGGCPKEKTWGRKSDETFEQK